MTENPEKLPERAALTPNAQRLLSLVQELHLVPENQRAKVAREILARPENVDLDVYTTSLELKKKGT